MGELDSIDDVVGAVHHALMTDGLAGPVNVCAPDPVTFRALAQTLGRVLGRPAVLPVPAPALRLLFGEMADTALLGSQRAVPARLLDSGIGSATPRWNRRCASARPRSRASFPPAR